MTPEEQISFETRLQELEKLFPTKVDYLKTKIMSYDKVLDEGEKIKNKFDDLFQSHLELLGQLKLLSEELQSHKKNFDNTCKRQYEVGYNTDQDVRELKKDHENLKMTSESSLDSLRQFVVKSDSDLYDKILEKPSKSDVDLSYNILKVIVNDLTKKFEDQKKEFDGFKQRIASEVAGVLELTVSSARHVKDHKTLQDAIDELKSSVSSLQSNHLATFTDLKNKVSDTHQSMWTAISKIPAPDESLKGELDKKLEIVSLDSKNAAIRSQNSDQKIVILEKKIESINLLLKKYELNQ